MCYEAFTLVHDHALLIVEQALRDRLMQHYGNRVTFVDTEGDTVTVDADSWETIFKACRGKKGLVVGDDGPLLRFRGMLPDLTTWARRLGYFRGQQNRHQERIHGDLRNLVAHASPHLTSPVAALRELQAAAEIINQLWGHPTHDGKYYPAPRPRHILALGWSDAGGIQLVDAHRVDTEPNVHADWSYIIIRAVAEDPHLFEFNSRYEMTSYPAEWLWGPGTVEDAAAWMRDANPMIDAPDHLDRTFAIRFHGGFVYAPQRPELALKASSDDQRGEWFLVRADHPSQARIHVRNRVTSALCQKAGPCKNCAAHLLVAGTYDEVFGMLEECSSLSVDKMPPLVATPSFAPYREQVM